MKTGNEDQSSPIRDPAIRIEIDNIRKNPSLDPPPRSPRLPILSKDMPIRSKLFAIQKFIESFQYNYRGVPFIQLRKDRGMHHIFTATNTIIRAALPIQCVEACFIASVLTTELTEVDRVPLSFKSKCEGSYYRHIVLAVRAENKWGALGISRRNTLMHKKLRYSCLFDLVKDFKDSYALNGHKLVKTYLGLPFSRALFSDIPIKWKYLRLSMKNEEEVERALASYSLNLTSLDDHLKLYSSLDGFQCDFVGNDKSKGNNIRKIEMSKKKTSEKKSPLEKTDSTVKSTCKQSDKNNRGISSSTPPRIRRPV